MKVQYELKKIFQDAYNAGQHDMQYSKNYFDVWLEENQEKILALVKPEPLAKNKDCESKCDKGGTFPCSPNIKFGWMHCTECDKTG